MTTPTETAVVVFTVSETVLRRRMNVATGPCVPVLGQKPLCSPLQKHGGEQPRHTAALFEVLTGIAADKVLEPVEEDPPGQLFVCAGSFVEAMAHANDELQRLGAEDDAAGDKHLPRFTQRLDAIDAAWLQAASWPKEYIGMRNRLAPRLGVASEAQSRGDPLWCWYGPRVPEFAVVAGQGPYPGQRK